MDDVTDAEARRDTFSELMFQYGDDPHYWDYAQWIADMLFQALEHIEGLVGKEAAAAPLRQLVQPVANSGGHSSAETWRDVVEDTLAAGTVWPISDRLHYALLYGMYGVTPESIPLKERAGWIANLVEEVATFAARSDVRALEGGGNAIIRIANLASSRHHLDTGRGEVDVHSLAVLGGVSEGRVRNLLSGSEGPLERGPEGGIVAMSALTWLQKRKDFLNSIWAEDEPVETEDSEPAGPIEPDRITFVPVARDGSIFNPDLIRGGVYQIGAKGEEQTFSNFTDALAALNAMPVPRWRRPNDKGHWGIVSGVAWQRVERQQ
ncbi:hypothetical protein [Rubellimicrobium arenae]|uniref:hypothetical protein n=1 Tax=Rubellimicrobium arenae TaxID=2817372 RepID=UPI001B30EEEF|nr:hypothetical protein [Rubellimicrobium arenae]